jgi:hypothetical protein
VSAGAIVFVSLVGAVVIFCGGWYAHYRFGATVKAFEMKVKEKL